MKKMRMLICALALVVTVQGCYGPFELTKAMHKWNGSVGDKWVNEVVFLVTGALLPVYSVCAFVDVVVLNSIYFWTGNKAFTAQAIQQGDMKVVMTPDRNYNCLRVDMFKSGVAAGSFVLYPNADGTMRAVSVDGTKIGTVRNGG